MSIESLLIAAQILDSQEEEGSEDQDVALYAGSNFCNSPPSHSSSNDSTSRKSPSKSKSSSQKGSNNRRSEKAINREVHNRLEKNRRAQMKEGFEKLKKLIPNIRSSKISSLALLKEVTNYVNVLKSEYESKLDELKNLETRRISLLNNRKCLRTELKAHHRKFAKMNNSDNESTSTASEGDEADFYKKHKKSFKLKNEKSDTHISKNPIVFENALRPSVLVPVKDEQPIMAPERKMESHILYSHLTSTNTSVQDIPKEQAEHLPLNEHINDLNSSLSCSNTKAAAESLLSLNSFQNAFENVVSDKSDEDFQVTKPVENLIDKVMYVNKKQIVVKRLVPETVKDEKGKVIRKRKALPEEKSAATSVIQPPKNKVQLVLSNKASTSLPIQESSVASSCINLGSKLKNGNETLLLQGEDKAKYIVAFRPYSTTKANVNQVPRASDGKRVIPKVLLNTNVGKAASDQFLLISNAQSNSSLTGSECKPQLMMVENELKFISCKPVLKEEADVSSNSVSENQISRYQTHAVHPTSIGCERVLIKQEPAAASKLEISQVNNVISSANRNLVPAVCDKKSQDIVLQVPQSVLPSIGLVLSPISHNQPFSEAPLCVDMAPHKSEQNAAHSGPTHKTFQTVQEVNASVLDNAHLLKGNRQNNFGICCNDSKLYFIAVQNPNKTVHLNGANI